MNSILNQFITIDTKYDIISHDNQISHNSYINTNLQGHQVTTWTSKLTYQTIFNTASMTLNKS